MTILVRFISAPGMTAELYDKTLPLVEASGEFPPDGLEYHVAFSAEGSFPLSEIWDVELAGPPEILEVHNIVKR